MPTAKILVVDDELGIRDVLSCSLRDEGYQVLTVDSGERALVKVREENPEVLLLDIKMPGMDGIETLGQIREFDKESSIIILTGHGGMDSVVEAMKLGAYDYLTKPFDLEKLKSLIKGALETKGLARKVASSKKLEERYRFENIVGKNPKMFEVYKRIGRVVDNKSTVLIRGETGTGKELVARAIHFNGTLREGPFVAVDCASLPRDLWESELFGHEKGAFTGAIARKLGKFELASKGTLFYFLRQYNSESQGRLKYFPLKTLHFLMKYNWPGNVRELENVIERALVMGKGDAILPQDLPLEVQEFSEQSCLTLPSGKFSLKERVAYLEKELITAALEEKHWTQTKAARLLGISRRVMRYKMEKYGIEVDPTDRDPFFK